MAQKRAALNAFMSPPAYEGLKSLAFEEGLTMAACLEVLGIWAAGGASTPLTRQQFIGRAREIAADRRRRDG